MSGGGGGKIRTRGRACCVSSCGKYLPKLDETRTTPLPPAIHVSLVNAADDGVILARCTLFSSVDLCLSRIVSPSGPTSALDELASEISELSMAPHRYDFVINTEHWVTLVENRGVQCILYRPMLWYVLAGGLDA